MAFSLLGSFTSGFLGWMMGFLSLFLVLLILIQRGKGGGLTGALGGPGGQSAFGSKAGDTFTVITIVVASIWGFTCAFAMWLLGTHTPPATVERTPIEATINAGPGDDGSGLVIPPLTGSDTSSIDGIGTPDLVPADAGEDSEAGNPPGEQDGTAEDADPESDAAESDVGESGGSDVSESDAGNSDSSAPSED